jgi:two-component system response regulator HydG
MTMTSGINTGMTAGTTTGASRQTADGVPSPSSSAVTRLLVVDDEPSIRSACRQVGLSLGLQVDVAENVNEARNLLASIKPDLVLLDLRMPGVGGMALLHEIHGQHPDIAIVVMTAFASVPSAVEAMRVGAVDYLTKPFALADLIQVLERARERRQINIEARLLREKLKSSQGLGNMIGRSQEMEKLYRIIGKVAQSSHPVLILGESGTGKEVVARAIHSNGPTANRAFIPVDCGSLVPTLIESELFGYVKGAFTGAIRAKEGLLTMADGGTVFLDEIGELPLDLQAKLLRALQEKEVRPVGSTQRVPLKARILAATNRDLAQMVEQGRFRKDLYFRLNVVNLRIPPLRDRRSDIPMLAAHFLDRMQRESGIQYTLSDDSLRLLTTYDWPGNVRELENCIERACALSSGPVLHLADLPTQLQDHHRQSLAPADQGNTSQTPAEGAGIQTIAELERQAILSTIDKLHGDKLLAAKLLGIGKTTLYRKLKEYGISDLPPDDSPGA